MILIADSGSTKCDWLIADSSGNKIDQCSTIGFNPYFCDSDTILKHLNESNILKGRSDAITHVYFYGSGCSSPSLNAIIKESLKTFFCHSEIEVEHDLLGAAYATFDGEPNLTGILGTGSNSCYFDGSKLQEATPSLGYILGDEGSGSYFGKTLIKKYFYHQMPKELTKEFEVFSKLTKDELVKKVYKEPNANSYLAQFSKFLSHSYSHPYIKNLLFQGFSEFIEQHIICYPQYKELKTSFIGSIAFNFQDELNQALSNHGAMLGSIYKKPIDNLLTYHIKYK